MPPPKKRSSDAFPRAGPVSESAPGRRPSTITVSDIVGPPIALDLFGARLLAAYPFVPLTETTALALAFFSYDGRLFCGLNADAAVIDDLPRLADDLVAAIESLPRSPH